jgi:hypothetical protein
MPPKTKMNTNARRARQTSKTATVLRQSLSLAATSFSWAPSSGEKTEKGTKRTNRYGKVFAFRYKTTLLRHDSVRGGERTKLVTTTGRVVYGIERGEGRWVNERGNHHHYNNTTSQNTHTAHIWGEHSQRRKKEERNRSETKCILAATKRHNDDTNNRKKTQSTRPIHTQHASHVRVHVQNQPSTPLTELVTHIGTAKRSAV